MLLLELHIKQIATKVLNSLICPLYYITRKYFNSLLQMSTSPIVHFPPRLLLPPSISPNFLSYTCIHRTVKDNKDETNDTL